jgi:hypothetical protein
LTKKGRQITGNNSSSSIAIFLPSVEGSHLDASVGGKGIHPKPAEKKKDLLFGMQHVMPGQLITSETGYLR